MVAGTVKPAYLIAGGIVAVALLWAALRRPADTGAAVAGGVIDLGSGVIGEVGQVVGGFVGLPRTNADIARELMDAYPYLPWYDQATAAFKISGYASASDYLKWVADKSHRPMPGAY